MGPREEPQRVPASDLARRPRDEHFALQFTGDLELPADGTCTFHLAGVDGSEPWLDEERPICRDGLQDEREADGTGDLRAGLDRLDVRHFDAACAVAPRLERERADPGPAQRFAAARARAAARSASA